MSSSPHHNHLVPHSILKKPHPASIAGTPRSQSPVHGFRTTDSASSGTHSPSSLSSALEGLTVTPPSHDPSITPTTPYAPSPLRGNALSSAPTTATSATNEDEQVPSTAPLPAQSATLANNPNSASVTFSMPQLTSSALSANAIPASAPATSSTTPIPAGNYAPLPSILRSSSSQSVPEDLVAAGTDTSNVSDQSMERNKDGHLSSSNAGSPRTGVIGLPATSATDHRSPPYNVEHPALGTTSPSSALRSASPSVGSADRSRLVGRGGYGGRRGGPALNKKRTSSSGGLSDVDMRPGYERKVGFDTMVDADDTPNGYFTFCLQVKSRGYMRTKNTRTFMCAVDDNTYSERALEWLMESLVSDGDEIVALRVLDGDPDAIDQDAAREEARELMASIVELNDEYGDRSISIVVEFVAGRVTSTILALTFMYRPDSVTVGTRGRSVSALQKMLGGSFIGSCSRDILNRCPVPVVIVRPEAKVKKHLAKRQNDPKRRSYHDLVALSKDDHLPLSVGRTKRSGGTHNYLHVPRNK